MRRRFVLAFLISTFISSLTFASTHASTVNLPPKADLEAAVARIESFADYSKYYNSGATPITPSTPYYQEYEYLHSLVVNTTTLIQKYDNPDFTARNAEAYGIAITAIDQAIISCRYVFGIVRAESLAAQTTQAAQATQTSTPNPAPASISVSAPIAQTTPVATTSANLPMNTTSDQDNQPLETSVTSQDDNHSEPTTPETPAEIPNTGTVTHSSPLLFIVIVSFAAATGAAGLYFIYNRQSKPVTPASRRKRH